MANAGQQKPVKLGFLDVVEADGRGFVGGLLITNHAGRPLEFQCTTPVRPDRTHEILYGKSLRPWLFAEIIGTTLLKKTSIQPGLIVVADADLLELRDHTAIPVALVEEATAPVRRQPTEDPLKALSALDSRPQGSTNDAVPARAGSTLSHDGELKLGGRKLILHQQHSVRDTPAVREMQETVPNNADLSEPLERVREALGETIRTVFAR